MYIMRPKRRMFLALFLALFLGSVLLSAWLFPSPIIVWGKSVSSPPASFLQSEPSAVQSTTAVQAAMLLPLFEEADGESQNDSQIYLPLLRR